MRALLAGCSTVMRLDSSKSLLQTGGKGSRLVTHATSVRHTFQAPVVHSLGHVTSERQQFQPYELDRTAPTSLQSKPFQDAYASHDYGIHSPAYKPALALGDSHTRPANSHLAAFGCYRVIGPARISKRGDTLVAHLLRGSRVELLDRDGNPTSYTSMESMTEEEVAVMSPSSSSSLWSQSGSDSPGGSSGGEDDDDGSSSSCVDVVGECVLVAAHVELCGSAGSVDVVDVDLQPAVHRHNGHTYVSVRSLPAEAVIELDAGSDLRHPINVTPSPPPPDQCDTVTAATRSM